MDYATAGVCSLLLLSLFAGLEVLCDDFLVPSLGALSRSLRLPHDVASATVLALGGSAAEIVVSCVATLRGSPELSLGAIAGSGMIACTIIPALCALAASGAQLQLEWFALARDCGAYLAAVAVLLWAVQGNEFGFAQCGAMMMVLVLYLTALFMVKRERRWEGSEEENRRIVDEGGAEEEMGNSSSDEEEEEEICEKWPLIVFSKPWKAMFKAVIPPFRMCRKTERRECWPMTLAVSMVLLGVLADVVFEVVVRLANAVGISHHGAGMTVLAVGTQVEDIFSCLALSKRNKPVSAMASAIGSQIYNIVLGIGGPILVYNSIHDENFKIPKDQVQSVAIATGLLVGSCGLFILLAAKGAVLGNRSTPRLGWYDSVLLLLAYVALTGCAVASPYLD